jgi:hypothetical protein
VPENADLVEWEMTATPDLGAQINEGYRIPADDPAGAGDYSLAIAPIDPMTGLPLCTPSVIVKRAAIDAGAGKNISLLIVGDSKVEMAPDLPSDPYRGLVYQLYDQLQADNILAPTSPILNLMGNKGTAPYRHCGYGGRTVSWFYSDPASPFVLAGGGTRNIPAYMAANSIPTTLSAVVWCLGTNDPRGANAFRGFGNYISGTTRYMLEQMIFETKAWSATPRHLVVMPFAYGDQDAFGYIYKGQQSSSAIRRSLLGWTDATLRYFDRRSTEGIDVIMPGLNIDPARSLRVQAPRPANSSVVISGDRPSTTALLALSSPPLGQIWQAVDTGLYWTKVAPAGTAAWRVADDRDGIVIRGADGVHEAEAGAAQVAAQIRAWIKNTAWA